jgi:hypothetical protein
MRCEAPPYESIRTILDLVVICRKNSNFQQCSQKFVVNTFPKARLRCIFYSSISKIIFVLMGKSIGKKCLEVSTLRYLFFWYVLLHHWANVDGRIIHGHYNTADKIITPITQQSVATSQPNGELDCTAARAYKLISLILSYLPATTYCPSCCSV